MTSISSTTLGLQGSGLVFTHVRLYSLKLLLISFVIWTEQKGKAGVQDTYIHSDVNYPLWHCFIKKHRLSLTPGVSAEQPKHNPAGSQ